MREKIAFEKIVAAMWDIIESDPRPIEKVLGMKETEILEALKFYNKII